MNPNDQQPTVPATDPAATPVAPVVQDPAVSPAPEVTPLTEVPGAPTGDPAPSTPEPAQPAVPGASEESHPEDDNAGQNPAQ